MNTRTLSSALWLLAAVFVAVPSFAQDEAQDEEALKKDLTAVIALHGQPCGQVIAVKVLAESDYAASCKDGNKYRVYLNADGRVVVEAQK
ncbi:MAG TPA: hypothetical protein VI485_19350 [Vicinamibacterales bacterium]|nr:hypothetical protein [Vicinamibacterales bacterium]